MTTDKTRPAVLVALMCGSPLVLSAETGAVSGVVQLPAQAGARVAVEKYRGKISGNVAPAPATVAGVWLEGSGLKAPQGPPLVTLPQTSYQFGVSLLVVPLGGSVAFPNNDPDYHNVYSLSPAKRFDLGRYKKSDKPAPVIVFDKAGFVALRCEIHDHMKADIIVVDSPHFTTTDDKGRFTLANIPPGNYTLHAQVDLKSAWQAPVRVQSGQTARIVFPRK